MTKEQLARWRELGFDFDDFYDTVAVDAKPKASIKFISAKQDDKQYIVKVAFTAKNCKTDIATISLNVVPKPLSFLDFAMVKNVKFKEDTNTFEFKFDVNPFEPNKFVDVDFVATFTIDGLEVESEVFQIEEKKDVNNSKKDKEKATENDWLKAAKEMGIMDVNLIKAIAYQESEMVAFMLSGNPKILYERHHFYDFYKNEYGKENADLLENKYPLLVNSSSGGYGSEKFFQKDGRFDNEGYYNYQFEKLNEAIKLNKDFAIMSTSFGVFQVLGEYYLYSNKTVVEFFQDMKISEKKQINAFVNFIKNDSGKKGFVKALNEKNWELVASIYNGKSWKKFNPNYAINIEKFYIKKPWIK